MSGSAEFALAPGTLLAALGLLPGLAIGAEAPPTLDEVVRETVSRQMSARARAEEMEIGRAHV